MKGQTFLNSRFYDSILFKCGLGVQADALPHGEGRQAGGGCGHLLRLLRGDARQAGEDILIEL